MNIAHRGKYPQLLDTLKLKVGAEIGVQYGHFSGHILANSGVSRLYSIDPWKAYSPQDYDDMTNADQRAQDSRYLCTVSQLFQYGDRSVVMRMTSKDAAEALQDNILDFVYIDANHSFDACSEDIRLWWPKVRPGGLISGHDYVDGKFREGDFGVKSAVDEFVEKHGLKLYVTEEKWPTWYATKE
jgi:hypothetical protein